MGHVHLQVSDVPEAEGFYAAALGFEPTVRNYPGALFVSAGGYHHHLGLNTWGTAGGPPPPPGARGLRAYRVVVPDVAEVSRIAGRLEARGIEVSASDEGLRVTDPAGNRGDRADAGGRGRRSSGTGSCREDRILAWPGPDFAPPASAQASRRRELAERAAVSRQLVGAIEAGRHSPAVDAALRLAAALDASVEELFGETPGGHRLLGRRRRWPPARPCAWGGWASGSWPPRSAGLVSGRPGGRRADGVVRDGEVAMLPGADDSALVVMGCDPVLGTLEALLDRRGSRRMVAVQGSSGAAVEALAAGRVHAALVHGPGGRPARAAGAGAPRPPGALAGGRGRRSRPRAGRVLEAILGGRGAPGAARALGLQPAGAAARGAGDGRARPCPPGRSPHGHLDAARRAAIAGCAAVTFEPAARAHGLRFLPLETHEVELWIDERWIDHPSAQALGDLLSSAAFRERARLVGGYDLDGAGALRTPPHQERR